jgi:hypothetical protein
MSKMKNAAVQKVMFLVVSTHAVSSYPKQNLGAFVDHLRVLNCTAPDLFMEKSIQNEYSR